MQDKGKVVLNSVWQMLLIFAFPIIVFLLIKEFVVSDSFKDNKVFNILGILFSYFFSWTIFFIKFFPSKKKKNPESDIKIEKIEK